MRRQRKPQPKQTLDLLPEQVQHALYEFLKNRSYRDGLAWLEKRGVIVQINYLCNWWGRYASRFVVAKHQEANEALLEKLKESGIKEPTADAMLVQYLQRLTYLNEDPELFLRYYSDRKKLELQERDLALREQKFERLKRIEEESRKALQAGGTEAELIAKWKQILNFSDES